MKTGSVNQHRITGMPHRQRGVVLLIALIILVAMTLAGIGMMRSVDTGSVIAGNLAFKQATLLASDRGIGDAFNALMSVVNTPNPIRNNGALADKQILYFHGDNTQPCPPGAGTSPPDPPGGVAGCSSLGGANLINLPGYFSTPVDPCEVTGQTTGTVNGVACTTAWQLTPWWTVAANWGVAPPPVTVTDPTNGATIATVTYLIHRMCQLPNAMQTNTQTTLPTGVQLCQTEPNTNQNYLGRFYTIFRITVRSVGTRNTVTYTQALAKIEIL